jgi:hypothetical protein
MLAKRDLRNVRFVASMAVQTRRAMGLDEESIRRESLAVGLKAINRHVADMREQESWAAALRRAVDAEIARG